MISVFWWLVICDESICDKEMLDDSSTSSINGFEIIFSMDGIPLIDIIDWSSGKLSKLVSLLVFSCWLHNNLCNIFFKLRCCLWRWWEMEVIVFEYFLIVLCLWGRLGEDVESECMLSNEIVYYCVDIWMFFQSDLALFH